MAISRLLRQRIESDAKAPDYWYVPKGQAVNFDNWPRIANHLQVLAEFQTVPWDKAQPKFAKALRDRDLIEPYKDHKKGFSAVARMQFPVWRLLDNSGTSYLIFGIRLTAAVVFIGNGRSWKILTRSWKDQRISSLIECSTNPDR